MRRKYILLSLSLLLLPLKNYTATLDANETLTESHITAANCLYVMQLGDVCRSIDLYNNYAQKIGRHDMELVQQLGMALLAQGAASNDPEIQLLTIFGAGISMNEQLFYILEEGIKSTAPELQVIALNFLADVHNEAADMALHRAMSSPFLAVRFEAVQRLVRNRFPTACGQLECLMGKIDKELHILFPPLFAELGDVGAQKNLRKLLNSPHAKTRISAIESAAKYGCDNLLPQIRALATHHHSAQQEACAHALGILKDESSREILQEMTLSSSPQTALAAWHALYQLGDDKALSVLKQSALGQNIFAINILGSIPGCEEELFSLTKSPNLQIRLNASLALLERRDARCLPTLFEILIKDSRDLIFLEGSSQGQTLTAWKVVPSGTHQSKESVDAGDVTERLREVVLTNALELPEDSFLQVADTIFSKEQNALVPFLVTLLENIRSTKAVDLLKKYQQKVGAPLIRHYCNLSLYRLHEPGPYENNLWQWICQQRHVDLIKIKTSFSLWNSKEKGSTFQLTTEETSRLLVESLEALAKNRDEMGISALLHVIQYGNTKNRYALAGLLIRAAE